MSTKLKELRSSLKPKVSQEDISRKTNITLSTYRNAENGKPVRFETATAILEAINEELQKRGQAQIGVFDMGLYIK